MYTICEACEGAGGFFEDMVDAFYEHTTREEACKECEGSGEVEIEICTKCFELEDACECGVAQ